MNAALGHAGVLLGLFAAVGGIGANGWGLARKKPQTLRSARIYAWLILAGAVVAVVAMERALITHDFSIVFVAQNNSRHTPLLYDITGLWSALSGSILLWSFMVAAWMAIMVHHFRRRAEDPLVAWATLVVYVVAAFFFMLMAGPADPFRTVSGPAPTSGLGPNVLLQDNPLIAFHPPILYAGFVGFTIPFAFAVASLVTGRVGEGWLVETRRWTLVAWGLLTIGIVLGAWWSYQVLGWGGFWGWDPVENAALLPWLTGTAYLHSVIVQERRGLLRVWNLSLLLATFSLTILATFLTRSGVLESVHAFSNSNLGPFLLSFLGVIVATAVGLLAWRGDRLRTPVGIDSAVSREGAFLVNNLLFAGFAFVVLLGTVFPLFVQALQNRQVSVGRPYFVEMTQPIGLAILLMMGIATALPWRKASKDMMRDRLLVPAAAGAFVIVACVVAGVRGFGDLVAFGFGAFAVTAALRQLALLFRGELRRDASRRWTAPLRALAGRRGGGMVVHVGVVIVAVAFAAASSYGHRGQVAMTPGHSATFDGHTFTYVGLRYVSTPSHSAVEEAILVDGRGPYLPAVSQYGANTEGVGTPSVDSGPFDDVYLTVAALPHRRDGTAMIGIVVQPLVMWLWVGGGIMLAGALLAAVPDRRDRRNASSRPN